MRSYLALIAAIIGLFLTSCAETETVRLEPPAPSPSSTTTSAHDLPTSAPTGHRDT
mgnify:CR=1 FL=1